MRRVTAVVLRVLPVLVLVSIGTAMLIELVPGDPAVAIVGPDGSPEQYSRVRQELGLDQSWFARYAGWLGGIAHGDFGTTFAPPVQEVSTLIAGRLPVTLEIALLSTLFALAVSVPVGTWSAYRSGRIFDRLASGVAFAIISIPSFLLSLLLIFIAVVRPDLLVSLVLLVVGLAVGGIGVRAASNRQDGQPRALIYGGFGCALALGLGALVLTALADLPRQGFVRFEDGGIAANLRTVALPVLALGLIESAQLMRVLRSDMATTLNEDYILAARSQGMPVRHILVKEALRPSALSLVTVAGISFGRLLGGTVIVETIFRLPGMGTLIVESVAKHEFMVLQASVLVIATMYVLVNAMTDLSYGILDPRTRNDRD